MEELLAQSPWLIPFVAVAFWFFVVSLIARLSGWARLAEYYPADDFHDGEKRGFQSMRIGRGKLQSANYGGCVMVGVSLSALRLSLFFPFRPGHAPLAIPFGDVSADVEKVFLLDYVRLRAARAPETEIMISKSLARWIEEKSGGLWRAPVAAAETTAATRPAS